MCDDAYCQLRRWVDARQILGCTAVRQTPLSLARGPPSVWRHYEGLSVGMLCISYHNCSSVDTLTNDNSIRQLQRNCKISNEVSNPQIITVVNYFSAKKTHPRSKETKSCLKMYALSVTAELGG